MFVQDSESARSRTETFGFHQRAFTADRRDHNRQLSANLLAFDEQWFYAFLGSPLFRRVVQSFISYRQLDGKVDRHSIQTYVGTIVSNTIFAATISDTNVAGTSIQTNGGWD